MPIHLDENHMNDPLYRASVADGIIREDGAVAGNASLTALEALKFVAESGKFTCFDDAGWNVVNSAIAYAEAHLS